MTTECRSLSTVGFVPLSKGFTAIVDANDLPWITQSKWMAAMSGNGHGGVYATRKRRSTGNVRLHRAVLGLSKDDRVYVDHISMYTLDNRRRNLRTANASQNAVNSRSRNGTSMFKGVHLCKDRNRSKWAALLYVGGKRIRCGYHQTEESAAAAYDRMALKHYGDFARLNFPQLRTA